MLILLFFSDRWFRVTSSLSSYRKRTLLRNLVTKYRIFCQEILLTNKYKSGKRYFFQSLVSLFSSLTTHWMLSRVMDWWTGIHFSFLVPFLLKKEKELSLKIEKKIENFRKILIFGEKILTKILNLEKLKHRNGNSVMWAQQITSQNERKMFL